MTELQALTLSKLRACAHDYPNMHAKSGFNAESIGGKKFADCARRMVKLGWVEVDQIADNHSRYRITPAGNGALLLG